MLRFTLLASALFFLTGITSFSAGVPNTVNYQGRLTNAAGDAVPDGAILVKFQIYDAATGGTVLWNSTFQSVAVSNGLFSYDLGSNVTLPDLFSADTVRYLGITVGADPEISPRTRFTSAGFVFKAQKSDLAMNADSLGGQHPSYYLDWGNMTSMPAGFADGVDDAGMDQTTADGRYVLETGDTMTGDLILQKGGMDQITLDANGERGISIFQNAFSGGDRDARLWGQFVGELDLWNQQDPPKETVKLWAPLGGELFLADSLGNRVIGLSSNRNGDTSVFLPDNAINSLEMLDEPGIAQGQPGTSPFLDTVMTDQATITITIPTAGYITLQGRVMFRFQGTTGANYGYLQIDETAGGTKTGFIFSKVGMDAYPTTGNYFFDCSSQRTYFKSAGTYTFRLEASKDNVTGGATCFWPVLKAQFFPTAYGTVTTVSGQPGNHPDVQAVSGTGPDGTVTTGYKMDLRYYEEKARAAEIAAQKAELEKIQAQTDLERARHGSNEK